MSSTLPRNFGTTTPKAVENYGVDFTANLGTDTIASVVWESVPEGLVFTNEAIVNSATQANVTISNGDERTDYCVICRVTTSGGLVLPARVNLRVQKDGA